MDAKKLNLATSPVTLQPSAHLVVAPWNLVLVCTQDQEILWCVTMGPHYTLSHLPCQLMGQQRLLYHCRTKRLHISPWLHDWKKNAKKYICVTIAWELGWQWFVIFCCWHWAHVMFDMHHCFWLALQCAAHGPQQIFTNWNGHSIPSLKYWLHFAKHAHLIYIYIVFVLSDPPSNIPAAPIPATPAPNPPSHDDIPCPWTTSPCNNRQFTCQPHRRSI